MRNELLIICPNSHIYEVSVNPLDKIFIILLKESYTMHTILNIIHVKG